MRYRRVRVAGGCYAFTVVTEQRRQILTAPEIVALFEHAVAGVRERHPFEVEGFVILPDHLHMIWTLPDGDADYSTRWRLIKDRFTRAYSKEHDAWPISDSRRTKAEQGIWQRRFWEHLIRDDDDFHNHLDYIHINPVRHGYVSEPREWPYSSFAKWVARGVYAPTWGPHALPELPRWATNFEVPIAS